MTVPNEIYPEGAVRVRDVLSRVAKKAWDVMSGVTKTAWDVMSRVTKTAWDVLSGARQFVENHFADMTIGRIRLLVDATFRRVRHLVEKK